MSAPNYFYRDPLKALLAIWLVASAYSAVTMYGFHHEDEVGQITAFYLHKSGVLTADELPWEHTYAVRPWIQPAIYYALFRKAIAGQGYNHLLFERVSYVLSFFLVMAAVLAFGSLLVRGNGGSKPPTSCLGVAAATCAWFLPSFSLRHSSEAFAAVLLIGFLWTWESSEHGRGPYAVLAGVLAGLTLWVRFHTAFFFLGWLAARFFGGREGRLWTRMGQAAASCGVACAAMVLVDWWGYGRLELTPWNYFREQVIKDVASYFGTSGWSRYLVGGSLALLNPLFFVWLALAIRRNWPDPFSRTVSCGVGLFFLIHLLTPHKELRFLVPVLPLAMLLVARDFLFQNPESLWGRRLAHPVYLRLVVILNLVAFAVFAASGTKSPRNHIEFALWGIDRPTTVFSATNLFQHFDRVFEEPFFEGLPLLNARFRKPADLEYVYVPPTRFLEACRSEPAAYVLITSGQSDRGGRLIEDQDLIPETEFPPAWAAPLLSQTRTWRFKLIRCTSLKKM